MFTRKTTKKMTNKICTVYQTLKWKNIQKVPDLKPKVGLWTFYLQNIKKHNI